MAKVAISEIKIGDRIRKEYGDIDQLAADIKENGLIQPIVISPDNVLLCGERRLKACQALGWADIDATIQSATDARRALALEISENENRKSFTVSERLAYAAKLLPLAKEEARERQSGERASRESRGKVRDIIARDVGFGSGVTYERARAVSESGAGDLMQAMDAGEMSVSAAYKELQRRCKEQQKTIDKQAATIKTYEAAEDEQSDAYEQLMQEYQTVKDKLRAAEASGNYHDRDIIVQNTIDRLTSERNEALEQRDDALDQLEKRVRPVMEKDPAAAAFVALGKIIAEAAGDLRKDIAAILERAHGEIVALCR